MGLLATRAVVAALVVAGLGTPARADHTGYRGGCWFDAVAVPTGVADPVYDGVVYAAVAATDAAGVPTPTADVTVECELLLNADNYGPIFTAAGTGVAAGADHFVYSVYLDASLCEVVTVGAETTRRCDSGVLPAG